MNFITRYFYNRKQKKKTEKKINQALSLIKTDPKRLKLNGRIEQGDTEEIIPRTYRIKRGLSNKLVQLSVERRCNVRDMAECAIEYFIEEYETVNGEVKYEL